MTKALYYLLIVVAIYLGFCAFNDIMTLHPFSAMFETLLAIGAYFYSHKFKPE